MRILFLDLKITVWDSNPSSPYSVPLTTLSHPIKVISKPINQRKNKKSDTPTTRRRSTKNSSPSQDKSTTSKEPQACLSSCEATDRLDKLELQQQQTLHLLHQLLSRTESPHISSLSSPEDQESFRPAKRIKQEKSLDPFHHLIPSSAGKPLVSDFENIFFTMLQAYSLLSSQDKANVIGRVLRSLSHKDNEQLEELVDNLRVGGVDTYLSTLPYNGGFLAPSENLALPFIPEDIYE